jgi:hypothetical protein
MVTIWPELAGIMKRARTGRDHERQADRRMESTAERRVPEPLACGGRKVEPEIWPLLRGYAG